MALDGYPTKPPRVPGRDANGNPLPAGGPAPPRNPARGNVGGPGATDPGRGVDDYLFGKATYTAGFPGYRGELAYNDRLASAEARGQQQELGNAIQDRALGRGGPSVAELQLQRGMNQGQQRIAQQAASARGMSRGGAQMAAIRGASDLYANTNEQAGIMRAQEQIAAQQLASQNVRDMRQQDLLARGYSIEEAKAIMDAEIRVQDINAQTARANAANAQGPAMMGIAALGGLAAASDARSKEIMYSDFTMKEDAGLRPDPARTTMLAPAQPEPPVRAAGGFQPMLTVAPTPELDKSAEEHQRSLGEQAVAAAAGAQGGSDLAQSAKSGFDIGSALGGALGGLSDMRAKELMPSDFTGKEMKKARAVRGAVFDTSPERIDRMGRFEVDEARRNYETARKRSEAEELFRYRRRSAKGINDQAEREYGSKKPPVPLAMSSDFRAKEPTMADLDQVGREAMLPFEQMNEEESRQALAPVDPVVYRYKEGPSARMADEQAAMADMRARYAGMGGAEPEETRAIQQGTFEDKREPRLGIVAQQLQQSPAFRQSVVSTPAGLAVQRDRALSTALGSLAGIDKRLRELEGMGRDADVSRIPAASYPDLPPTDDEKRARTDRAGSEFLRRVLPRDDDEDRQRERTDRGGRDFLKRASGGDLDELSRRYRGARSL